MKFPNAPQGGFLQDFLIAWQFATIHMAASLVAACRYNIANGKPELRLNAPQHVGPTLYKVYSAAETVNGHGFLVCVVEYNVCFHVGVRARLGPQLSPQHQYK